MITRGVLVTFEGIDGCGKTTQARFLYRFLKKRKIPVILLKEPGGTPLGEAIRKLLLHSQQISAWSELFLYLASRAQLVEEVVRPALAKGKVVILDRYLDSTLAYQGYGRKLPLPFIRKAHHEFLGTLKPDLTFLLDARPEELSRILSAKGPDRMEKESLSFQKRVRRGYLILARENKNHVCVIRRQDIKRTREKILREWEKFFQKVRSEKHHDCRAD